MLSALQQEACREVERWGEESFTQRGVEGGRKSAFYSVISTCDTLNAEMLLFPHKPRTLHMKKCTKTIPGGSALHAHTHKQWPPPPRRHAHQHLVGIRVMQLVLQCVKEGHLASLEREHGADLPRRLALLGEQRERPVDARRKTGDGEHH